MCVFLCLGSRLPPLKGRNARWFKRGGTGLNPDSCLTPSFVSSPEFRPSFCQDFQRGGMWRFDRSFRAVAFGFLILTNVSASPLFSGCVLPDGSFSKWWTPFLFGLSGKLKHTNNFRDPPAPQCQSKAVLWESSLHFRGDGQDVAEQERAPVLCLRPECACVCVFH